MPVKIKIALFFTLLTAIILALITASVYYFSYSHRVENIKAKLTNRAITIAHLLSQRDIFSNQLIGRLDTPTTLFYINKFERAYDDKNNKIYEYTDLPIDSIMINAKLLNEAREEGNIFFESGKKDAVAYHYINSRLVIIAAGEDAEGKQQLNHLINILILSYSGGLIIACLSGYFFSKQLLKPIKKIADTVNRISAQNLSTRINTGKTNDEWNYLSDTLNSLLNKLQDSFDMQKRFIANASHELSTPLTSISNQIEVSLQKERNADEYRKVMESVDEDAVHMRNFTKTLLEFAKASGTPGGIEISKVRMDEILLRIPAEMQKINKACSVLLKFEDLPEEENKLLVSGNEELLFIAIKNLVINACKYSNNNQAVIKLNVQNELIIISVSDDGIGIPSAEFEKIFQPFQRIQDVTNKKGFGIGLTLASRIIKMHKGEIEVASSVNIGSTFIVRLPIAK
ncbi:MAG: sensor histidine kinase [Chitinophagaceae bacterium]